jgi:hypothetical protein
VRLPASGREYASWPVNAPASTPLDVSADDGISWHPTERPADNVARVLVAGPSAPSNPPSALVLPLGRNDLLLRLSSTPEVVVRRAGTIVVFDPGA